MWFYAFIISGLTQHFLNTKETEIMSRYQEAKEIVRNNALDRVFIATDYFDASINRISAWVTGMRSVQKALLNALLQPVDTLKKLQNEGRHTELMVLQEELKTAPFGDVWAEYLKRENVNVNYIDEVLAYEKEVLSKR